MWAQSSAYCAILAVLIYLLDLGMSRIGSRFRLFKSKVTLNDSSFSFKPRFLVNSVAILSW